MEKKMIFLVKIENQSKDIMREDCDGISFSDWVWKKGFCSEWNEVILMERGFG